VSGVIVFAMGFVIVVLLCLLAWQVSLRVDSEEAAMARLEMIEQLQTEINDLRVLKNVLESEHSRCRDKLNHARRDLAAYEKMAADLQFVFNTSKPITDDDIPF
jgi:hypothetical protein